MNNANLKYVPELEQDFHRNSDMGYEPEGNYGYLRCFEHGAPHPLIRWHQHEEYELHLITETSGKMFVGDYIGEFHPGNLVLIGPNVPHNWISNELPDEGVPIRSVCLQFSDKPFRKSCDLLPELNQALPLLNRAKFGVEFYGISDFAFKQLKKIKENTGIRAFREFLTLILELSEHSNYKTLSSFQLWVYKEDRSMEKFSEIVDYVAQNYSTHFTMAEMAEKAGMDSSQFSRCFKSASGNTFTSFVNHLRVNHACELLSNTDKYISTICYLVGFSTVSNFNRRFIEIKKMTPSEYRKKSLIKYS